MALRKQQPQRKKRTPIGVRNVLTAPVRDGYVRRWVNDRDDRIERFREAGYEPVTADFKGGDPQLGDPSKPGSTVVKSVGGGVKSVLMEIPKEYYDEDQVVKIEGNRKRLAALKPEAQQAVSEGGGAQVFGEIKIER